MLVATMDNKSCSHFGRCGLFLPKALFFRPRCGSSSLDKHNCASEENSINTNCPSLPQSCTINILFDHKNVLITPSTFTSCEFRWDLWWLWDGYAPENQLTGICSGTSSSHGLSQSPSLGSSALQSWLSS